MLLLVELIDMLHGPTFFALGLIGPRYGHIDLVVKPYDIFGLSSGQKQNGLCHLLDLLLRRNAVRRLCRYVYQSEIRQFLVFGQV